LDNYCSYNNLCNVHCYFCST